MNYKKILKHTAFIVLVPSVIVIGYYGNEAFKAFRDKKKRKKEDEEAGDNKEESGGKVISINKKIGTKEEKKTG